jgi:biopolymer transport protein ExbB/TolQ
MVFNVVGTDLPAAGGNGAAHCLGWCVDHFAPMVLALIMERSQALRRKRIMPAGFLEQVRRYWYRGDVKAALLCCDEEQASIARILKAGLEHYEASKEEIEKALEAAGQFELYALNSNVRGFGLVANLAPMLGFLGTVTGMIQAFNAIAAAGTSTPGLVAHGVSEALLTTARSHRWHPVSDLVPFSVAGRPICAGDGRSRHRACRGPGASAATYAP